MLFLNHMQLIVKNFYKPKVIVFCWTANGKGALNLSVALVLIYLFLYMRVRCLRISAITLILWGIVCVCVFHQN